MPPGGYPVHMVHTLLSAGNYPPRAGSARCEYVCVRVLYDKPVHRPLIERLLSDYSALITRAGENHPQVSRMEPLYTRSLPGGLSGD